MWNLEEVSSLSHRPLQQGEERHHGVSNQAMKIKTTLNKTLPHWKECEGQQGWMSPRTVSSRHSRTDRHTYELTETVTDTQVAQVQARCRPSTGRRKQAQANQDPICNWCPLTREKSVFSNRVSLHAQELLIKAKQTRWHFCRGLASFCIANLQEGFFFLSC